MDLGDLDGARLALSHAAGGSKTVPLPMEPFTLEQRFQQLRDASLWNDSLTLASSEDAVEEKDTAAPPMRQQAQQAPPAKASAAQSLPAFEMPAPLRNPVNPVNGTNGAKAATAVEPAKTSAPTASMNGHGSPSSAPTRPSMVYHEAYVTMPGPSPLQGRFY